jgi:uncharacterized protein
MYAPTPIKERIDALDSTRGFALIGILFVHMVVFATPGSLPFLSVGQPPVDRLVLALIMVFIESKFFSLFSLMFGMGFALQYLKAERKRTDFVPFFRRRLFFLGIFGILHIVLLWEGDILLLYALVGLLQIPFRNVGVKTLRRWIIGLLAVPLIFYTTAFIGLLVGRTLPQVAPEIALADVEIVNGFNESAATTRAAYDTGSYTELLQRRLGSAIATAFLLTTRIPTVLAMFLIGLYCGKTGILTNLGEHTALLRRVRLIGLTVGLGIALLVGIATLVAPPTVTFVAAFFNQALAGPLTGLGYGAAFALFALNPSNHRVTVPLAAYGRMALTNYLLQSLIATTLFYGYGLGLIGEVSRAGAMIIAVGIHLALIGFSILWLRVFRFGPMEWLWRSLNYSRIEPIRISTGEVTA